MPKVEASTLVVKLLIQDAMDYKMELTAAQFQLPLMLPTGANTVQEFLITALLQLTTQSYWSEPSVETGKSRTPGEQLGEKLDTSD